MAASPRFKARIAGLFWLLTAITGSLALAFGGTAGTAVNLVATACYVVATILVYSLLKPVNKNVSLLAAAFSFIGCTIGTLAVFVPFQASFIPTLFFGLHCLLVGCLILKSTFLPRFVGVMMVLAGVGWLTRGLVSVLTLPVPSTLFPYLMGMGVLGEMTLTAWLLAKGVDERKWWDQAGGRAPSLRASAAPSVS